ncbi:MAG: AAA family ATPase [Chloroflexi bacterium]|nr:AAA family ATPase [Chloroflexota bacterium]
MATKRVLLIGGTSNVGKSTLAEALAGQLGWHYVSTDKLGRHPGRPWPSDGRAVPQHVAEHYLCLSVDELIDDVLRYYGSLQPKITALVTAHATDHAIDPLVIEGSALWPEFVAPLKDDRVAMVWLTASDALLQQRIYHASRIAEAAAQEQRMIQKFVARTLRYNAAMMAAVQRLGLASIRVEATSSLEDLSHRCLELLR